MIAEPEKVTRVDDTVTDEKAAIGQSRAVTPHTRSGRSLPPR